MTARKREKVLRRARANNHAFLLALSDALRLLGDPEEIEHVACRMLAERLTAERAYYVEIDEAAGVARVRRDFSGDDARSLAGEHRIAGFGWSVAILRRGECYVVRDIRTSALVPAADHPAAAALGIIACMGAPLIKDGALSGALCVTAATPRDWSDGDVELLREVGERIWSAVERARAEARTRESEERFRQFAEWSSDVIWIRNADTLQFEYVSPAIERIYGVAPEAFMARHDNLKAWAEMLHHDDRAGALAAFRRVRAGERVTHEFRIHRPDDGERWIRNTDFPLLDAHGRVQRIAGIGEDVTELKRAEAAIAESEMRLRTLTEGIPQLVWRSCDQGRWTWASPQWLAFTGQTQEQTHGSGWLDAVHPDDRFATMKAWRDARPHGMLDVEYRVLRARDRAWVWHHTRSVPVRDADGRIIEWLGTSTDIQGLRELQERQAVLVAELQHRTRNLIGVVRSVADKSMRASADLPDFRDRFGHRMQALSRVQGLLSKLSEGERVTFDALLGAEMAALDAGESGRVTLDGPPGVALRSGTVQTLALALHELATNAVKYGALGQSSGRLRVTWRVLPPDGHPPRLRIDWRETGVAMPPPGSPPRGTGQGRDLIERALPYQLDAETTYVFHDDGVECSIIMAISSRSSVQGMSP